METTWIVALVSLILALVLVWRFRVRGTRRWHSALDSYAEREIARARQHSVISMRRRLNQPREVINRLTHIPTGR